MASKSHESDLRRHNFDSKNGKMVREDLCSSIFPCNLNVFFSGEGPTIPSVYVKKVRIKGPFFLGEITSLIKSFPNLIPSFSSFIFF